ncbi:extracellular catalytic domain type 1 short-chain-length polyhydroxyalkanoate depolymerase [Kitasatospora viridis]|uniref:Poly(Hydroxyalkanoate) depolymerase family esterase n=1 Tax=Kitasatospora viridis TaxID=281105 RepID=A0A561SE18_9ACTN|nr:PHB depolymerase family esterase [Kitasatospora viridis]TWF73090.1 poly(hydroxyalkanoate) depolymerase family esterase [Kitasatospora viridis]
MPKPVRLFAALALAAGLIAAGHSSASAAGGTFQQVTGFGSNPGNLAMYSYAPAGLPAGAPLVVALHGCAQTATDYYDDSGWPKYADLYGFAVVFPQTDAANNSLSCFNWFDSTKDTRGNGEAASVVQMVAKAEALYGSDSHRVFVTGLSAGGGLTADLLADYPDMFAGGAVDSGLPAQCATTETAASGCQYGSQNLTPAQWGDKVRASDPGYTGPWPRVAIWQGTADTTVQPVNGTELRDQWTNTWGIGQTPSSTASLPGGTTLTSYDDASGNPAVQLYSINGMGHGLAVDPGSATNQCGTTGAYFLSAICSSYYTAQFWGLAGGTTGTGLPAPTGLTVSGTTATSVSLTWQPVSGASSYDVYRDGTQANASPVTGTTYTDSGLAAGTSHSYTVAAVDASGNVGTQSAAVTATTSGGYTPSCYTTDNYDQTVAGRAFQSGGLTYATGSGQAMGLWNVFTVHTLEETAPGYYVVADSGCPA